MMCRNEAEMLEWNWLADSLAMCFVAAPHLPGIVAIIPRRRLELRDIYSVLVRSMGCLEILPSGFASSGLHRIRLVSR